MNTVAAAGCTRMLLSGLLWTIQVNSLTCVLVLGAYVTLWCLCMESGSGYGGVPGVGICPGKPLCAPERALFVHRGDAVSHRAAARGSRFFHQLGEAHACRPPHMSRGRHGTAPQSRGAASDAKRAVFLAARLAARHAAAEQLRASTYMHLPWLADALSAHGSAALGLHAYLAKHRLGNVRCR